MTNQAQKPKAPTFPVGEYITIKGVLFKTRSSKRKRKHLELVIRTCGKVETDAVNIKIKQLNEQAAEKQAESQKTEKIKTV